jgi:hypothetical protein
MKTNKNKDILAMYRNIAKFAIDIAFEINDHKQNDREVDKYTLDRSVKLFESIKEEMVDVDFTQFNTEELKTFGFNEWDDDGLMLAPRWVFAVMKSGTQLTSISGETKTFGIDNIDMDTRFGVTAWGLTKAQLRDHKLESIINESEQTN